MFPPVSIQPSMFAATQPPPITASLSLTRTNEGVSVAVNVHHTVTGELLAMQTMLVGPDADARLLASQALARLLDASDEARGVGPF